MDLISVLLPTYNEKIQYLKSSIDSILNQTYVNIELILINDNPDRAEMASLLKLYAMQDKRIVYLVNPHNIGLVESLNKGLNIAKGQYIARMDADDISVPERLEKQILYLKTNNLDLVGSEIHKIDENDCFVGKLLLPTNESDILKYLRWGNCILHPTWLCKKEIYLKLNGYRQIPYAEDYDFVLRAVENGYRIGNIPNPLLKYRIQRESISNVHSVQQQLVSYYLEEYYKKNRICSLKELQEYLTSPQYAKLYYKLEQYYKIRAQGVSLKSVSKLLINQYLYKSIIHHVMKKIQTGQYINQLL